uniref:Uncharacterized protein n=1 Tax=Euplotes harpa TaxID=151035 RepID=A0A7S3J8G1_9SPIT|mmetsp:Transcript_22572/g.25937  ORF Transcript_22572/g.25937 Transcript_22572/m.25937 type:complete len:176 (+) Transcript_22572:69-596(+)
MILKKRKSELNRKYDPKQPPNEKLSFLTNMFTRPCALVEDPAVGYKSEEEPSLSLATASRLANITRNDENDDEKDVVPQFSTKNIEAPSKIRNSARNINVDFENLNDEVKDQGQSRDNSISDLRSSQNYSREVESKDSLTFKPEGVLHATPHEPKNYPMSFGTDAFISKGHHDYD